METIILRDPETGGSAMILPGFGFNCCELIFMDKGEPVPALWSPEGFRTGELGAFLGGIPVLFPFPGLGDFWTPWTGDTLNRGVSG